MKIGDLFEHRHLLVAHPLTPAERPMLRRITRGLPQLRTLREIVAVERGNRRHRKMQKTVYRVRTQQHIHARIAIDMLRDARASGRFDTTQTLHHARAG